MENFGLGQNFILQTLVIIGIILYICQVVTNHKVGLSAAHTSNKYLHKWTTKN